MKLIDADELRKRMYHDAFETDSDMQKWDGGCWIRYKMFENAIEDAPTIKAEPVRRGRWEDMDYVFSKCSLCGCIVDTLNNAANYCPNCGAKMEEQE